MHLRHVFAIAALAAVCCGPLVMAQPQRIDNGPADSEKKKKKTPKFKKLGQVGGFDDWVTSIAWSPDGKTVAAGGYDEIKLIDAAERRQSTTLKIKGFAHSLRFSPDGKTLAVGGFRQATLWNVAAKKAGKVLKGHRGYVMGLAYSADGKLLATAGEDSTVRLWNTADGSAGMVIEDFEYPVMDVALSPDGKLLATASGDETRVTKPGPVRVFEVATGKEKPFEFPPHEKVAYAVKFSPDNKYLISTGNDEKVNVYDLTLGKALGFFDGHGRPTNDAEFIAKGDKVLSVAGGRAKGRYLGILWNRTDGTTIAEAEGHQGRISCVAVSPDGKVFATGSYDQTVMFWDLAAYNKPPVLLAAVAEKPVKPGDLPPPKVKELKVGIIGLDTSHVTAFTKLLNDSEAAPDLANCRVVAAYPKGSPDILSSTTRVPKYTEAVQQMGVEIVHTIPDLIEMVDVVLLETNDGRPHLEQVLPVLRAGKPVFIDKPVAGSLTDAVAIYEMSRRTGTPVFSSSSLRFMAGAQEIRGGKLGKVTEASAFSPCILEKTHPDLYWYGIHGVELLFTMMGTGCESVKRTVSTPDRDVVVGTWKGDRKGTFTGYRAGRRGYGGEAVGSKGKGNAGQREGYRPLLVEIVKFFRTRKPPVTAEETLEIYAFMSAADESKRRGGASVSIAKMLQDAKESARQKLDSLIGDPKELGAP